MSFNRDITKRLMDLAVDGIGLYTSKKIVESMKPYTVKTLKQYNDPALKIAMSLADLVFPQIRGIPYLGDWLGLWGKAGINEFIELMIDKPPVCYALDSNTIECVNFDELPTVVKINGTEKTAETDYTIEGTADSFKIALTTALSSGTYDLVVVGKSKAFAGKIYV
jgi:hypothetical protein